MTLDDIKKIVEEVEQSMKQQNEMRKNLKKEIYKNPPIKNSKEPYKSYDNQ